MIFALVGRFFGSTSEGVEKLGGNLCLTLAENYHALTSHALVVHALVAHALAALTAGPGHLARCVGTTGFLVRPDSYP